MNFSRWRCRIAPSGADRQLVSQLAIRTLNERGGLRVAAPLVLPPAAAGARVVPRYLHPRGHLSSVAASLGVANLSPIRPVVAGSHESSPVAIGCVRKSQVLEGTLKSALHPANCA